MPKSKRNRLAKSKHGFTDEPVAALRQGRGVESAAGVRELLAEQFADSWFDILPAIALAGAAYPIVIAFGQVIFLFFGMLSGRIPWDSFFGDAGYLLLFSALGAGVGLIWASVVAIAVLPSVYLIVRSLELRGSIVRLGAFCGGLVGFIAVCPLLFVVTLGSPGSPYETAIAAAVGPALATAIGQVGGAWGAWRSRRLKRRGEFSENDWQDGGVQPRPRLQFGIRHLLVISVWVSLFLAAIRFARIDYLAPLSLLIGWLMYQTLTLWVGELLVRQFLGWRRRRQSRST